MNKSELVNVMAKVTGLSKVDAGRSLDAFIKAVSDMLSRGKPVKIPGFGSFVVVKRPERDGHNPSTGERIVIPAALVPKFRPGVNLKKATNKVRGKEKEKV